MLRGAAGTGKTMVICARARLLRERHPAWRILVLCFNTSLASLLRRALPAEPRTEVATFHEWAQAQLEASGVVVPPPPGRGTQWDGYWTQDMARLLLTAFREQRIAAGAYQAILIDEGQDFVGDWYRALVQALDPATASCSSRWTPRRTSTAARSPGGTWASGSPPGHGSSRSITGTARRSRPRHAG